MYVCPVVDVSAGGKVVAEEAMAEGGWPGRVTHVVRVQVVITLVVRR